MLVALMIYLIAGLLCFVAYLLLVGRMNFMSAGPDSKMILKAFFGCLLLWPVLIGVVGTWKGLELIGRRIFK